MEPIIIVIMNIVTFIVGIYIIIWLKMLSKFHNVIWNMYVFTNSM